ncbi:kinase-like domain-containing protein [Cyathus striatus]|nr:kinase-like domain-containing protein [Cyathus striatus]
MTMRRIAHPAKPDILHIADIPRTHYDIIKEGPISTVARTWTRIDEHGEPQWVAVKTATTFKKFAKEPHDVIKELRIMSDLNHPNIIQVLGSFRTPQDLTVSFYMPYVPICFPSLLASPFFSPHPFPPKPAPSHSPTLSLSAPSCSPSPTSAPAHFTVLTKSIMLQLICAIAYLHSERGGRTAHRDIKPENVLFTPEGMVKLVDFGIAYRDEEEVKKKLDLWPERDGDLYFEVSTGSYRAPELLFGTRAYDPFAIDLWSLGATFAGVFTPLRLMSDDDDDDDDELLDSSDDDGNGMVYDYEAPSVNPTPPAELNNDGTYFEAHALPLKRNEPHSAVSETSNSEAVSEAGSAHKYKLKPLIIPRYLRIDYPGTYWRRDPLFSGDRGEIGLAWSIFKVLGTPTKDSWPEFEDLPSAKSVVFNLVPAVPLWPLLPNLPPSSFPAESQLSPSTSSSPSSSSSSISSTYTVNEPPPPTSPLDLLSSFLQLAPSRRITAQKALQHPWFSEGPLLLPNGYEGRWVLLERNGTEKDSEDNNLSSSFTYEFEGRTLGQWLEGVLVQRPGGGL